MSSDLNPALGHVLAVDDDESSRVLLSRLLDRLGYQVTTAGDAEQARNLLQESGADRFDCILIDYFLPGQDGLALLEWMNSLEAPPAAIIVSSDSNRETVRASLHHGATEYLLKPVRASDLKPAVATACLRSRNRRLRREQQTALVRLARIHQSMMDFRTNDCCRHFHHARGAVGGDWLGRYRLDENRSLVMVADVSGHDLVAGFISAYFQGFVRGLIDRKPPAASLLAELNSLLCMGWSHDASLMNSISLCAIDLHQDEGAADIYRCGSPLVALSDAEGAVRNLAYGPSSPLGWFDDLQLSHERIVFAEGSTLVAWTDGLEALAEEISVAPLSLAYRLLDSASPDPGLLARADDDVLVVRLAATPAVASFLPLLVHVYPAGQQTRIDDLQAGWERSLRIALPGLEDARLFDVLLCLREGVLNAFEHGCRDDGWVRLSVSFHPARNLLRARIEDPGFGHSLDIVGLAPDPRGVTRGRGLVLIRDLSQSWAFERGGAALRLDWDLEPSMDKELCLK